MNLAPTTRRKNTLRQGQDQAVWQALSGLATILDQGLLAMRELAQRQWELNNLREDLQRVESRLAREKGDAIYEALKRQYVSLQEKVRLAEEGLRKRKTQVETTATISVDKEVEGALRLLEEVERIAGNAEARQEINPLLVRLGIRIGLRYGPYIKGKKREVRRLLGGVMAFGDAPLPLPLFGKDNAEGGIHSTNNDQEEVHNQEMPVGPATDPEANPHNREEMRKAGEGVYPSPAFAGDTRSSRQTVCPPEGVSITKVNRGEPYRTLVIETVGLPLALSLFPKTLVFSGDSVLQLVEPGLYRKGWRVPRNHDSID